MTRKLVITCVLAAAILAAGIAIWRTTRPGGKAGPKPRGELTVKMTVKPKFAVIPGPGVPGAGPTIATGAQFHATLAAIKDGRLPWGTARRFLRNWADYNSEGCLLWSCGNLPAGGERAAIVAYIFNHMATGSPEAALLRAMEIDPGHGRADALRAIFAAWAVSDPAAAARAALAAAPFAGRSTALAGAAMAWARRDLDAVTTWAWALPAGPDRATVLDAIAGILPELRLSGNTSAAALVSGAATVDPAPAPDSASDPKAWFQAKLKRIAYTRGSASSAVAGGVARFATADGDATWWAFSLPAGSTRDAALSAVAVQVAITNPAAAALLVEQIENPLTQSNTYADVANATASATNAADGTMITNNADGSIATTNAAAPATTATAEYILAQERPVALSLAEQLPDSAERSGIIHALAVDWGTTAPAEAMAWAMDQLADARELEATLKTILWDWATRDALSATEWAVAQTDPARRDASIAAIVLTLSRRDPTSASALAITIVDATVRSPAIGNVAFHWAKRDAAAATAWANTLTDAADQSTALAEIARAAGGR